jgi:uncharacterized sodium:solute symporter family permease YidK
MNVVKVFQRKLRATTQNSDVLVVNRTTTAIIAVNRWQCCKNVSDMQNTIHPRDLIVGLQKGLALIQLFPKIFPGSPCLRRRK